MAPKYDPKTDLEAIVELRLEAQTRHVAEVLVFDEYESKFCEHFRESFD